MATATRVLLGYWELTQMRGHAEAILAGLDHELDQVQYEFWSRLEAKLDKAIRRTEKP